jgi:hypothetical protein
MASQSRCWSLLIFDSLITALHRRKYSCYCDLRTQTNVLSKYRLSAARVDLIYAAIDLEECSTIRGSAAATHQSPGCRRLSTLVLEHHSAKLNTQLQCGHVARALSIQALSGTCQPHKMAATSLWSFILFVLRPQVIQQWRPRKTIRLVISQSNRRALIAYLLRRAAAATTNLESQLQPHFWTNMTPKKQTRALQPSQTVT